MRLFYSILFSLCTFKAFSQAADTSLHYDLSPVSVRAVRGSGISPFAKTDLDQKTIEKQNLGADLPFLLQYTPSAVVTSDAGAGVGYTGIRLRGTDGTRINITLNGVPVNDAESQITYFVDLPDLASSASSLQVQRGIGSSTNGAGAFGGTISISNLEPGQAPGIYAGISYGSFNTQKYTVKAFTGWIDDRFALDMRASRISSDGYIDRSGSALMAFQLGAYWKVSARNMIRFMALAGDERTHQAWDGVPQDSLLTNRTFNELGQKSDGSYYDNQTDNYRQNYFQLFDEHQFSDKVQGSIGLFLTRGIGYYEEYKTGGAFADYGLPDYVAGTDIFTTTDLIRQLWLDNYNYGGIFSLICNGKKLQNTFGGGISQYDGKHYGLIKWAQYGVPDDYEWYRLQSHKSDINLYYKGQARFGRKLLLYAELQGRSIHYDMNGFRNNPLLHPVADYFFFNPKAGINYFLKEQGTVSSRLYLSAAQAGHEPNRDDFEAGENEQPKAEQLTDLEAGFEMKKMSWDVQANFYYMNYTDQLVLTGKINDVGAYTRTNVPKSHRAGLELIAAIRPLHWLSVNVNGTLSENKISDFEEYVDDYTNGIQILTTHHNTDIAFSPSVIAGGGVTLTPFYRSAKGKGLEISLMEKYVGKQFLDNTSNEARSLKAYVLTDIRLRYAITLKHTKELSVNLVLNNIFNRMYESNGYTYSYRFDNQSYTYNYYYPQAGFNWLLGIGLKL